MITLLIRHDERSLEVLYPDTEEGVLFSTPDDGGVEMSFVDEETGHETSVVLSETMLAALTKYCAVRHDEEKSAECCHFIEPNHPYPFELPTETAF